MLTLEGKDHYLGKFDCPESRELYNRLVAEWMEVRRNHVSPEASGVVEITVGEVLLAYWRHAQGYYLSAEGKPTEEIGNIKAAIRPVRRLYGLTPAGEFGSLALRSVRGEMLSSGLARSSINDRVNRIRRAFRWAASVEMIQASVVQALGTVAGLQRGRTEAKGSGTTETGATSEVGTTPRLTVLSRLVRF